ncbi:MAG: amidohydrolase family protein [Bacillota bacterium]
MLHFDEQVLRVSRGETPAEVVLKNCRIVDVFTGAIISGDIAINGQYIVGIGSYNGQMEIDVNWSYIAPGFIDGHVHIESSMVSPCQFAAAILPRGTTTVIADPHELANVYGTAAIEYFLKQDAQIPLDIYLMLPSCVPATDLETSGAVLGCKELEKYINHPKVLGLGEMMNYPGVIYGDAAVWNKISLFRKHDKIIDGHIQAVDGELLCSYVLGGIRSNHECISAIEASKCLQMGMKLMLREGTAAKNLKDLLPVVNKYTSRHCMLVTDDRHPTDLRSQGHIDYLIRLCIESGMEPVEAIQMATINTAQYFGLKDLGAIAPGYLADLVVLEDLSGLQVKKVMKKGAIAAEEGRPLFPKPESAANDDLPTGIKVKRITEADLQLALNGSQVHVIEIIPGQITTRHLTVPVDRYLSGCSKNFNPFMALAFLSLPVIPQLRLTDKGLVDVDQFKIIELVD